MTKLKLWNEFQTWEEAHNCWEKGSEEAREKKPIKSLNVLPQIPGITKDTARFLKLKSFKYLFFQKEGFSIFQHVLKHPFRYGKKYLTSLFKKKSYKREGDFFLYGLDCFEDLKHLLKKPNSLFVVGFSYCQKPFECPSGRFSSECIYDKNSSICRQCEIGKAMNALPDDRIIPLFIPTIHYIGNQIFEIVETHPDNEIFFLITACEMTLEMFGDFGNMVGIRGVGVRLDGRICNTMKAFELSEKGIKPGLTVLTQTTSDRIFDLIRTLREI